MDSRLLQLSDSAFPAGAFAHSGGFEALRQLGALRTEEALVLRLRELCWNVALSVLPFLNDAHCADPIEADRAAEVFLANHVANRASRSQGAAFLLAADAMFGESGLRDRLPHQHLAVSFGAALKGFPLEDVRQLFVFGAVRNALSASVRLGITGPLRAQRLLAELHPLLDEVLRETRELHANDAVNAAPLLDIFQTAQDRLYSRLFQS
ncbi:MAG: urease accessory protein UreF [Myxococcaceae bacterium]